MSTRIEVKDTDICTHCAGEIRADMYGTNWYHLTTLGNLGNRFCRPNVTTAQPVERAEKKRTT